ncbi:MAG: hypothetical protein SXA11_19430 [Cyanobacteriota bacterium]|nr:hypothetical protein [Cyanobacteriota bacterium]
MIFVRTHTHTHSKTQDIAFSSIINTHNEYEYYFLPDQRQIARAYYLGLNGQRRSFKI